MLAIFALATCARRCGLEKEWQDVGAPASLQSDTLVKALNGLAQGVEDARPDLAGLFTRTLVDDIRQAGAALPTLFGMAAEASNTLKGAPDRIAAFFDAALVEVGQGSGTAEITTSGGLARLMTDLLEVVAGTVFDPCCGLGSILAQIARGHRRVRLSGQDLNAVAVALARLRLEFLGARGDVVVGDALAAGERAFLRRRFDRVVCDPPVGGRLHPDETTRLSALHGIDKIPNRSEVAFLLLCAEILEATGRAVVLMPANFLFRNSDREVRRFLVETGRLEGVLTLPKGVVPWTDHAFAIAVLNGDGTASSVAIASGEDVGLATLRGAERLADAQIRILAERYRNAAAGSARRPAADLLAGSVDLRPFAGLPTTARAGEDDLLELHRIAQRSEMQADELKAKLDALPLIRRLAG